MRRYDFETAGAALLNLLRQRLGEAFDGETQAAWAAAYALVAREMRRGMASGDTVPDDLWTLQAMRPVVPTA